MAEISSTGDQMLAVLEAVAARGALTAAQVAQLCGINRTVAHRLLATLAKRSYVRKTDGGYRIGPAIAHLNSLEEVGLKERARPHMLKLAQSIGETVVLHVIERSEAVVLDQAVGTRHLVRVEHTPGSRHPLCRGASGWSILAFQTPRVIQRVLRAFACGENAEGRLAEVRAAGYAVSYDELQMGVHGLAVPIFNKDGTCEASLGILVPSSRAGTIMDLREDLIEAASRVSASSTKG